MDVLSIFKFFTFLGSEYMYEFEKEVLFSGMNKLTVIPLPSIIPMYLAALPFSFFPFESNVTIQESDAIIYLL